MTIIYLAVDEDGTEVCCSGELAKRAYSPVRWVKLEKRYGMPSELVELPPGTIEKLTGRKITWKDEPIEYSGGE